VAEAVLDASALIAFLRNEPGAKKVAAVLNASCISAVTLAVVIGILVEQGKDAEDVAYHLGRLNIPVVPFDVAQARIAASLSKATQPLNLSLGDRACLALAAKTSLPAYTADGDWGKLDVGVKIVRIR
jgi:PIN domain nuclease of toxin-antitoxin system